MINENINNDDVKIILNENNIIEEIRGISEKDIEKILQIYINNEHKNNKNELFNKEEYDFLIEIMSKLSDEEFIIFISYFNYMNINMLLILINNFIESDFDINESDEKNIINIISKTLNIYCNKDIFYYLYEKLSLFYRKRNNINIKKFEKAFKIWKLLYNIESYFQKIENNNNLFFFPINAKGKNNIIINIGEKIKNAEFAAGSDTYIISIYFKQSPLLNINKFIQDFSFIILEDSDRKEFRIKYEDIFVNNFSEINSINFELIKNSCEIKINNIIKDKKKTECDFNKIKRLELLNNFYGEISLIEIQKSFVFIPDQINQNVNEVIKEDLKIKVIKKDYQAVLNMELNGEKPEINKELIQCKGEIFSSDYYDKILKANNNIDLQNIKYYGGFDCFFPLLKIINYIIGQSKININNIDKNENNIKNEQNNDNEIGIDNIENNLSKSIIWIKDILKIILKMICISENNYRSFLSTIVSLIGSLAEILETLKAFPNNYTSLLLEDDIFFIFYIIILNSSLPNNIKKFYKHLFKIDECFNNYNFKMDPLIFDLNKNRINDLDWYSLFLFNFIMFLMLYFESTKLIPENLVNQLVTKIDLYKNEKRENIKNDKLMDNVRISFNFNKFVKHYCLGGDTDVNELFKCSHEELKENEFYLKSIINMIKTFLNAINSSKNPGFKLNEAIHDKIKKLLVDYTFSHSKSKSKLKSYKDDKKKIIINGFKDYINDIEFLAQLFPFLEEEQDKFTTEKILIMNEFIDYHGQYHHTMKELFIFNRLWSDQNLFFKNSLEEIKNSKIKYKVINYYTRNFQRPILYPCLDYKKNYPEFSKFDIKNQNEFYKAESEDDYNFEIECPDLDELIEQYDKKNIRKIEKTGVINFFENICLVKRGYHVKGNIFVAKDQNQQKIIIYFYSLHYSDQFKHSCNKDIKQNGEDKLCYGSIFKCPKKEGNRKIVIDFDDIRLMIKKIFYYKKSAIEIFTETKSYYFNFFDENRTVDFFNLLSIPYKSIYYPININNDFIGIIKVNHKILEKHKNEYFDLTKKSNDFIEFISNKTSKGDLCEMCIFDLIMLINLISNRSYNDLHQYPIFPVLYFYDKKTDIIKDRDINSHIGLQNELDCSKLRYNLYQEFYNGYKNEFFIKNNEEIPHYFNTHYSNIVYTCNYLIRLFPYSFLSIELQGDGFDDPNRLFYSIEDTLNNISSQKSDLRELIPEFFYLPEMFMNINYINFHKRNNDELVDDVDISKTNFIKKKEKNKKKEKIIHGEIIEKKEEVTEKYFIYVNNMKKKLESSNNIINGWINIIFGTKQKFNSKNELYFRSESYIDKKENDYQKFIKDNIIMSSVEFGLIPLQTIYNRKLFSNLKNNYEKIDSEIKSELKNDLSIRKKTISYKTSKETIDEKKEKIKIESRNEHKYTNDMNKISKNYFNNNEFKDYWEEPLEIKFRINNNDKIGILKVYKKLKLIDEIADHNNKIIDYFYNRRLNMFATASYDGFICVYILPNKLISMIKHPDNSYFDQVMISSNPFPSIIAFDKKKNNLISYSLSGIIIKNYLLKSDEKTDIKIEPIFNIYGGTFKDRINICYTKGEIQMLSVPFFEIK